MAAALTPAPAPPSEHNDRQSAATAAPRDLPAPPQAALRVLQVCADPSSDARQVAAVVEQDPSLTAEVLKVVNSAFFGLAGRVKSVQHAVSILGQRGLRNYVLCLAVREALRPSVLHGLDTGGFWKGSLTRGVAGRLLAPNASVDPDVAFTACLLQDIGLLAMVYGNPSVGAQCASLLALDPPARLEFERSMFERTHDQAGLDLAEAWQLPEEFAVAIDHRRILAGLGDAEDVQLPLARVAECANWMASVFLTSDRRHVIAETRRRVSDQFGLETPEVDELLSELSASQKEAGAVLGLGMGDPPSFDSLLREANLVLAEQNLDYQELNWRLQHTLDRHEALSRRLRDEVEKARLVQRALLPEAGTQSLFHGINVPARELSGDFFDFFEAECGRWCFTLGDVSGKGMDAALLMSKTSSLFHYLGKVKPDPSELLAALNQELCELSVRGMFVTMVAGSIDPASGEVAIANAGHPPALLVSANGRCVEVDANAPPLGIMKDVDFPSQAHALKDAALYLYSDGVMEAAEAAAKGSSGNVLLERIQRLVQVARAEHPARLVNALLNGDEASADDLTVLLVDGAAAAA